MKSFLLRRCLFGGILLLLLLPAFGQNQPFKEVSIASPTAASLGKYADIPVNYHTGIPQISVPLYNVQAGPLELPVSLNYHASGLKVMEPASWVGAGWSLNAGGVITRSVQGTPDEKGTGTSQNQTKGYFSDYGYSNYIMVPTQTPGINMEDWSGVADGSKDGEPDLFFYNFGNYSGKFYFKDDRTPIFVPEQDIKVEYNYSGTGSIQGFILTTPDGIQYYFGNTPGFTGVAPVEITKSVTSQGLNAGAAISSWYLNKIVSSDGQFTITLSYQTEGYGYFTTSMFPVDGNADVFEYSLVKNVLQGVKVSQITFPNGNISFSSGTVRTDLSDNALTLTDNINTEARSLDTIKISNTGSFCKKYLLSYSYFIDNTTSLTGYYSTYNSIQTDRKRLRLDSLKELSCDGILFNPPHKFDYYNEQVPRRLTFAQDHWGFYNGAVSNQKLIPTYTLNTFTTINGANRESSWPQMRGGALNKITYPTGGTSTFDFEPHTIWTSVTQNQFSNVSSITIGYTGNNPLNVTNTVTLSANTHKLTLNNSSNGSTAILTLYNNAGTNVGSVSADPNTNNSVVLTNLPSGSYQLNLYKDCRDANGNSGGNGANGNISVFAPVTISQNTTVGGLRIKTITYNDNLSPQNNIVTSYLYDNNNGESNGVLFSKPVYVQAVRNDMIKNVGYWSPSSGFSPSCSFNGCVACDGGSVPYFKSANSIRPMGTTQGNHIGYGTVKRSQTGNGYSIYQYYTSDGSVWGSNQGDFLVRNVNNQTCNDNVPNYPSAPLPFDFKRGELSYEGHFNQSGQLLNEVSYYPTYTDIVMSTPSIIVTPFQTQLLGTKYYLKTAKKTQFKVIETAYSPGIGNITSTTISYFESPYHRQVTRKVTINSLGETVETRMKYSADFRIQNCDNILDGSQQFINDSIACQNQYNSARSACGSSSTCIANAYLNYLQCLNTIRINYVNHRRTNFTNTTNLFKSNHDNAKAAADAELKPILELQDQNNIAGIEISSWKRNQLASSVFNRFDYANNPVGKVYFQKSQSINLSSLSATFTAANTTSSGTSIVKDNRYSDEFTLKFDAGNLAEIKKKDGVYTSYIWGYSNTLPIVKAKGVSFETLKAAYDAAGGNLTILRSQPSLATAFISTYVYTPLLGITSETDTNSRNVYYEYDGFGRLQYIKDHDKNIIKAIDYKYQQQQ